MKKKVSELVIGDMVDLENDPIADPNGDHPEFKFTFLEVREIEKESETCICLSFDNFTCGFPLDHEVEVTVEGDLNEFQQAAAFAYTEDQDDSLFLIKRQAEAEEVGDTLFEFLMIELSDTEDCDSFEEAERRVRRAIQSLEAVANALNKKLGAV
jgi:hypothetical protein